MRKIAILLLALLPSVARAEDSLGRLFFTPAQRATLDAGKELEKPKGTARAVRGPRVLTVNGIVTRSDGESTVWVNGRALDGRPAPGVSSTASGSDPAAARVKVSGARNTVQMLVGQRLERSTGKITEPYESNVDRTEVITPVSEERASTVGEKPSPRDSETVPAQSPDN